MLWYSDALSFALVKARNIELNRCLIFLLQHNPTIRDAIVPIALSKMPYPKGVIFFLLFVYYFDHLCSVRGGTQKQPE